MSQKFNPMSDFHLTFLSVSGLLVQRAWSDTSRNLFSRVAILDLS